VEFIVTLEFDVTQVADETESPTASTEVKSNVTVKVAKEPE
jgi:hypothetical protein